MRHLLLTAAMWLGGCVVDEHHHHWHECYDDAPVCNGDLIEQCIDGEWVVLDDCWDLCEGTCAYDQFGDPACYCS
jgi:hypothetical protein